ncbi:MAG: UDP-3-O-[3-hydroxymyristoyl] N-acetylglucosamine deacetylase [Desulfovibrionaceae bacterium]|nr:UDP-3-O-[3-hydroxymyristoyl] N-acetylglucosamine deacetylase [Desulfovibrionaceae bacterium]
MPKHHNSQHTFARSTRFAGKGLHTGKHCNVTLNPAGPNTGIVFRRTDLDGALVPAHIRYAQKLIRCSGLMKDGATIRTCEHLLAALYGCGIDNALVDMDAEEVPIFDGSAASLMAKMATAGKVAQDAPRSIIKITEPLESRDKERFVRITPAETPSIDLTLTLRHFGSIGWTGPLDREAFEREIAPARTFAPMRHALPMKLLSLITFQPVARGLRLDNVLLFAKGRVWNPGGLRFPDELPRHRVLDIIGDLRLSAADVIGKITAFRSSHALNQDLVRKILDT